MMPLRILVLCLALMCAGASVTQAQTPPKFTLSDALAKLAGNDLEIPPEWAGIWQIDTEVFQCGSSTPLATSSDNDTLCTGMLVFNPEDEDFEQEIDFQCEGSVTSTSGSYTCSGSFPVDEDCTAFMSIESNLTRTGESYTAVSTVTISYEGTSMTCGFLPDQCTRSETTGTRIAGEPASCQVPVETIRWGTLKAIYE